MRDTAPPEGCEPRAVLRPRDARGSSARPAAGGTAASPGAARASPVRRAGIPRELPRLCRQGGSAAAAAVLGAGVLVLRSSVCSVLLARLQRGRWSLSVPFACSCPQALPLARGADWEGKWLCLPPAPFLLSALTRPFFFFFFPVVIALGFFINRDVSPKVNSFFNKLESMLSFTNQSINQSIP